MQGLAAVQATDDKVAMNAEPMPSVAAASAGHESALEPKFDGIRILAGMGDDGAVRLRARSGNDKTGKLPAIEAELARALLPGSLLDGEAVVFERAPDGRVFPAWGRAQSVLGSGKAKAALQSGCVTYVAFDLLAFDGRDARTLPFRQRRELLQDLFVYAAFAPCVQLAPQLPAVEENHEALLAAGFEGSMVKWLDAPYRSDARGRGQFKLKAQHTVDAVVMDYKPGESGFAGLVGAIVFGQHDPATGELVERGRCSGMDFATRLAVTKDPGGYLGRVFELAHMGAMPPSAGKPHGALRHPQWKRWRDDKLPSQVVIHDA